MAKVLITGGAGFIGSRMARHCIELGHEVRVFDLVRHDNPRIKDSWVGSILDPYEISLACRGCDYILHAAAALGVERTEKHRLECLYINIQGTVNVLEAAVKEGVKKILFTSSSEVYGDNNSVVYSENTPLNPKSNYAITKLVGEEYLRAYHQSYGIDYAIVRFFSVYGEGQSKQFVVPKFVHSVLNGEPPVIYGDGQQVRSFCYVDDAARGAILALLSEKTHQGIFNIGNDQEPTSILNLAKKIISLSDKSLKTQFVGYEKSDRNPEREIYRRTPCLQKARTVLGYQPTISLEEGLGRMLNLKSSPVAVGS